MLGIKPKLCVHWASALPAEPHPQPSFNLFAEWIFYCELGCCRVYSVEAKASSTETLGLFSDWIGFCLFWCQMGFAHSGIRLLLQILWSHIKKGPGIGFCLLTKHVCFCTGAQGDPWGCQCCWVRCDFTGSRKLTLWHHAHCLNWQRPWFFFSCKGIKVLALYSEGLCEEPWAVMLLPPINQSLQPLPDLGNFQSLVRGHRCTMTKSQFVYSSSITSCF